MPQGSESSAKVFICYSHEDRKWLERLHVHLRPLTRREFIDLWDDTRIQSGEKWRTEIKQALAQANIAVLLISPDFFASDFISENELPPLLEAERDRGLTILGIHISPSRFSRDEVLSDIQTVNTSDQPVGGLEKTEQDKIFDDLARCVEKLAPGPPKNGRTKKSRNRTKTVAEDLKTERLLRQGFAGGTWPGDPLPLPCFFRSVSSHETQLQPHSALQALRLMKAPAVLVSAYDLHEDPKRQQIISEMRRLQRIGTFVLLDSGNYESKRKNDKNWTVEKFRSVLKIAPCDYAFCYDKENSLTSAEDLADDVIGRVKRDQEKTKREELLPIVHAPGNPTDGYQTAIVPNAIRRIAKELRPPMIAIPERELGDGIWKRVQVAKQIRESLDGLDWYQPFHLLGAGNPISIALFSAAGVDFFDGLEWCRTAVDYRTGLLHHYQHFDAFEGQTSDSSAFATAALESDFPTYNAKVAIHNLDFFDNWMGKIQENIENNTFGRFLLEKFEPLPGRAVEQLLHSFPEFVK